MARPRLIHPTYRKHAQTGCAVVSIYLSDGTRTEVVLPGKYGSDESKQEYERLLCQLRANGGKWPADSAKKDFTVADLVLKYMEHASTYYVDPVSKKPTTEQSAIREAVRPLVRMYGDSLIGEFDSLCLESVQTAMATDSTLTEEERQKKIKRNRHIGLARTTINRHIDRIKRIMRWGCVKKIVPPHDPREPSPVAPLSAKCENSINRRFRDIERTGETTGFLHFPQRFCHLGWRHGAHPFSNLSGNEGNAAMRLCIHYCWGGGRLSSQDGSPVLHSK